ncbi:hypothetical protein CYY_001994 [Polysphondylium violaceum]|uniref:Nucleosome assembly protein n=1 Tax=Polysphondylium violaceum TaxID=133409 RepID=A0A8J4UVL0_9MYCE|nr:hypothetical protein CYY_001994 [Polysphondylium violaceum]
MSDEVIDVSPIQSTEVLKRVNALLSLQDKTQDICDQMEKEIEEIKKKYGKLMEPLFEKRGQIVSGSHEPTEEETKAKEEHSIEGLTSDASIKGIPNFWLNVLRNDPEFGLIIQESDIEPLSFLSNIVFVDNETDDEEKESFTVEFHFNENEFFTNSVIKKTFDFSEEAMVIENTPIQFKEGKNFTIKKVSKSVKAKGKGKKPASSTKIVEEKVPGFFADFLCPSANEDEIDELNEIQNEFCAKLREIILPNAILFFLGRTEEFTQGYGDEGYDFDEDFDDEEDDDDEDDDAPPKKGGRASNPAIPNNPECKQQ